MSDTLYPVIGYCRKCKKAILRSHPYVWCDACGEPISDDVNLKRKPKGDTAHSQDQLPASSSGVEIGKSFIRSVPISTGALNFLRVVGWIVAVLGVIAGIIVLINAPEESRVQIQRAARLTHLSMGWGQIIGSIVTGILLNVVAGIGDAVLDIWKAQQPK